MAVEHVCEFYKFGHCKFMNQCRKKHIQEVCENNACEVRMCNLRHPRVCKFYSLYGRCKFEPCSYQHTESKEMTLIKQLHSVLEVRNNEFNALHSTLEDQKETNKCLEIKVTELITKSIALTNQTSAASNSAPQPVDGSQLEDRIKEVENTNYVLLHSIDDLEKEVKILQRKISRLTSCY